MIHSMTGFGSAELSKKDWRCGVELRSVNSRFLEVRFRLPQGLGPCEESLKNLIKSRCQRGKFECTIALNPENPEHQALALNKPLLRQYATLLACFGEALGKDIQVTLGNLIAIKDLISGECWREDEETVQTLIHDTLHRALEGLCAMRAQEGGALHKEMRERLSHIASLKEELEPLIRDIPARQQQRMQENVKRLMIPTFPDTERIRQELAILADRYDVSEEIHRLEVHLDNLGQMLAAGGVLGRKFEFLLQELNREANTLATKSNQVSISTRVVDIKTELEKLREQVQNIE